MLPESFSIVLNTPEYSERTPVLYLQQTVFNSSVHGFVQTTDLVLTEGDTQEVITMMLDVKGNTLTEPASTRVLNFGFSFTCIDSSMEVVLWQLVSYVCVLGETLHLCVV